ncbi:cysteine proteinase inhibitor B-like [Magnolia sinica]|uniref:cysteine proteinase inhibitor B-like n=1 Tax=Magnolia sinica TaxID=86752 RepID=UPI00265A879B|nr:cysteine proteinase inhibitor B-like [Magnolia sinica]
MAAISSSLFLALSLVTLSLSISLSSSLSPFRSIDGLKVGGKTEIRNVESNPDIQSLGKFSVDEYNKNHGTHLSFFRVFKAEKQVVSGMKYFLKISTVDAAENGLSKEFDAVVVVKPWARSKELLSFAPVKPY